MLCIDAISGGHHAVRAEMKRFAIASVPDLNVLPSLVTTYDPVLVAGDVRFVVVEANPNTINTENGQLSETVGQGELETIPIFTLNPIESATTLPEVQIGDTNVGPGCTGENGQQIEVNGARPRAHNFIIDSRDISDVSIGGQAFQPQ